jgi:small subunit ribosomal protein S5
MEASQTTQVKSEAAKPAFKPFPAAGARPQFNRNRPGQGGASRFGAGRFGGRGRQGGGRRDENARKDEFDSKLLDLSRVSHTRAGGRRLRFRAIVISGNKAGKVGLGVASGLDVAKAVEKATVQSKKDMIVVPTAGGTISREVAAKVGPARVIIKPQRKGRGLMAGGVVRLLCQLAGIKDISSKMLGTTKNKLNNARAVMKAFEDLSRQSLKDVAQNPAATVQSGVATEKEDPKNSPGANGAEEVSQ